MTIDSAALFTQKNSMKQLTMAITNQQFPESLPVGQAVEIRRGALRRMTGVIVGFGRNGNCLVALDGWQDGILLSVTSQSVRPKCPDLKARFPGAGETPLEWSPL